MRKLIKTLKSDLNIIRKAYKKTFSSPYNDILFEWLSDNYYILEREGMGIIKTLKKDFNSTKYDALSPQNVSENKKGLPRLYGECLKLCKNGNLLAAEDLEEEARDLNLTVAECECLQLMLKAALIHHAAAALIYFPQSNNNSDSAACINAIKSFRKIQDIDFDALIENISAVEKILSSDPSGIYTQMDDATKSAYRHAAARIAKKQKISETQAAENALNAANNAAKENIADKNSFHIGEFLELRKNKASKRAKSLIMLELCLPFLLCFCLTILIKKWYIFPLLLLPSWEAVKVFTDITARGRAKPAPLPRMELNGKIPEDAAVIISIATLLPSAAKVQTLEKHLSQLKRSNGNGAVSICVLADLKAAKTPTKPSDDADINAAKRVISRLNARYNGGFILAVRPRVFSKTQNEYTGHERKRGAILALCAAAKACDDEFLCLHGDMSNLRKAKYIMALDSDTNMPLGTLSELVSAALHPLNRPIFDKKNGRVTKGYGIFCPRVETSVESATKTPFARAMSGMGGITAYNTLVADRYQDLFHHGIFTGKGLIDIELFYALVKNKLPPQKVLSHDILEGEICRTASVADVQLTDSFPSSQDSYMARLHRWVRGDWQNVGFLFRNVKINGQKRSNPLKGISKYKIFDNIRRSLTPAACLITLVMSLFLPHREASFIIGAVLISASLSNLISALKAIFSGGISMLSRLFYSGAAPLALDALLKAALDVLMLAKTGFVCLDAIIRALYRLKRGKNLLEWVTAADADSSSSFSGFFNKNWKSTLLGIFLISFSPPIGRLAGLLFIINMIFSLFSSCESKNLSIKLDFKNSEQLRSYAAAMWKFYDEFCRSSDNFLPPDNVQETPVHRVAHRTSPTNIGLMLCCVLAARDMGFIDTKNMYNRLKNALDSIEKLEKWKGNLLNWYNTKNLQALEPKYCSAVDSGNFICCLIALNQGLAEYVAEYPRLLDLKLRLNALIKSCELSAFYNKQRALFHIGYDFKEDKLSNSYYDLLMSEARMLSYYAVSSGIVPKRHWAALGRTLAKDGRYAGPISWTGTMFEYFMPCLFMPIIPNTLFAEGLRFCLRCQKNRVKGKNIPYGISESGFYAFDARLNYQYKAHGVQKLGLKRALDNELVISPYSTFLSLCIDPYCALKNLKKLEDIDLEGRFGFYEAVDFTKSRAEGQDYAVVRSYMAHHVGMSFLAVANSLYDNCMQNRFMSDEQMAAGISLLEEKIPSEAVVFKDIERREIPNRPERINAQNEEISDISPLLPKSKLLSNGEWSSLISDSGISLAFYRDTDVTRRCNNVLENPFGIFAALRTDTSLIAFTRAPFYNNNTAFEAYFSNNSVKFTAKKGGFECETEILVHRHLAAEQRSYSIKNQSRRPQKVRLMIYFEPVLSDYQSEITHRAFSNMFLQSSYNKSEKIIKFSRIKRNSPETLCLAVGFCENINFKFDTARENILKRPHGINSLYGDNWELKGRTGTIDNCCALECELEIPAKSSKSVNLLLAAAGTAEEAESHILKIRRANGIKSVKSASSPFTSDSLDGIAAANILTDIYMGEKIPKAAEAALLKNESGKEALWAVGVSGDEPIICAVTQNAEDLNNVIHLIRLNKKLARCSIETSLILLYEESAAYSSDYMTRLREILFKEGCEDRLFERGGIIPVNMQTTNPESINALFAAAAYIYPEIDKFSQNLFKEYKPLKIYQADKIHDAPQQNGFTKNAYLIAEKPELPWCITLSNPTFGTLVSDTSPGFTWALNSRENKLTSWSNDTMRDLSGERLYCRIADKIYDLTQNAAVEFSAKRVVFRGIFENIEYSLTIEVPKKGMCKMIVLNMKNTTREEIDMQAAYYTEPILSDSAANARFIKSFRDNDSMLMRSPYNKAYDGYFAISAKNLPESKITNPIIYNEKENPDENTAESLYFCKDKAAFFSGDWSSQEFSCRKNPCAAAIKKIRLPAFKDTRIAYILSYGKTAAAAKFIANKSLGDLLLNENDDVRNNVTTEENSLTIETPDLELNAIFNNFLLHQIKSTRIEARAGFYQCGGAYGFRDQLQDASALTLIYPKITKRQILRSCAVQFRQGDVLHWWHISAYGPHRLKGVRTRYSDDLLWLPYVTAEYVLKTNDKGILDIKTPYLSAMELLDDEHDRFFSPDFSPEKASVFEHCQRAIERASSFGKHGLPLIYGGDWNDSFNRVGEKGEGESVWLAQFFALTLKKFAAVCDLIKQNEKAIEYKNLADSLLKNVDEHAWNGEWYLRAFYDDASPMGYAGAPECEIDLLPQAFAVLADMPNRERRRTALQAAINRLVDEKNGIIKLFSPPFTLEGKPTGYVNAYPQGVRENGGQYTHAAVWFVKALFQEGLADEAYRLLKIINPASKYKNNNLNKKYKTEAYALAADVYSAKGMEGRGGWSLYTGAAAWFYRTIYEDMLGIKQENGEIKIAPNLPKDLKGTRFSLNHKTLNYKNLSQQLDN